MSANHWPWSLEEEEQWEQELRREEFGWMEELIDHMISNGLASSSYDPLHDWSDEEILIP
jgi:hypothetical protein